jgi:hypothetical protein
LIKYNSFMARQLLLNSILIIAPSNIFIAQINTSHIIINKIKASSAIPAGLKI